MRDVSAPVLIYRLFPQLINSRWGYLNFNAIAAHLGIALELKADSPNPFLDQATVERWMNFIHKVKEIDFSWGGWLEDRAKLWRGHYQKPDECIHLGIDINVPVDTQVYMPVSGKLVHSFNDPDQEGGWGGKLIFECKDFYLVLGHLKNIDNDLGAEYHHGDIVGVIAETDKNGGWFPHLHVQVMKNFVPDVDGYSAYYRGIEGDYPNPIEI